MKHIQKTVPFYRNFRPSIEALPTVSKKFILEHLDEFIALDVPCERSRLIDFIQSDKQSTKSEFRFNVSIHIEQTSGSSGVPFCIFKTTQERQHLSLGIWRIRKSFDPLISPNNFKSLIHQRTDSDAPYKISARLQDAESKGARWLHASPEIITRFAGLLEQRQIRSTNIRFLENSGARIEPNVVRRLRDTHNIIVVNQYGLREVWAVAYGSCEDLLIPVSENIFLEILDSSDRPILEPGIFGRLVATCIHLRSFPFVRYETGDLAAWRKIGCQSGIELSRIRSTEIIQGLPNEVSGVELFKQLLILVYHSIGYPPIDYIQFRQLSLTRFSVVIVPEHLSEIMLPAIECCYRQLAGTALSATFEREYAFDKGALMGGKYTLFSNRWFAPRQS